jgi:serine/threonine protein kinase
MTLEANRWERMQAVFERALEAPGRERPAVLDAACGDDLALRREIEAMLAVAAPEHALAIERLVVTETSETAPRADPTIGQRFGAWRVVDVLGHGGMSTVYLAERADSQYEQRVALKIVRGGAFGESARQFHAERQSLARLSHPNIARLLDAGFTPDGSAYMVMEYVDGTPLTDYSDAHHLEIESRLA